MKAIAIFLLVIICSCAINSGVKKNGINKYEIYHQAGSGFSSSKSMFAKGKADALSFCQQTDKVIYIENVVLSRGPYVLGNFPSAKIFFRCVNEEELELLPKKAFRGRDYILVSPNNENSKNKDKYESLEKIKELYDKKVLTKEEYLNEKKKILEDI